MKSPSIVERLLHRLRVWQLGLMPTDPFYTFISEAIEDLLRANGYRIRS